MSMTSIVLVSKNLKWGVSPEGVTRGKSFSTKMSYPLEAWVTTATLMNICSLDTQDFVCKVCIFGLWVALEDSWWNRGVKWMKWPFLNLNVSPLDLWTSSHQVCPGNKNCMSFCTELNSLDFFLLAGSNLKDFFATYIHKGNRESLFFPLFYLHNSSFLYMYSIKPQYIMSMQCIAVTMSF